MMRFSRNYLNISSIIFGVISLEDPISIENLK